MKKIETLLNIDLGQKFDTRKALNRSAKAIPAETLEQLEAGQFTCEMIGDLAKQFPIFRYRTCITIHGNWGEVGQRRLGGYTNIIQNQNGSTEIKYSAIDIAKIRNIVNLLRSVKSKFYFYQNSSERYFTRTIHTNNAEEYNQAVQQLKPIAERVKGANIYGYLNLFAGASQFGGVDVILEINPLSIPAGEEMNFCYLLTGLTEYTWKDTLAEIAEAERLRDIADAEQEAKEQVEKQAARIAAEPIFQAGREVLTAAGYEKQEKTAIENGKIYIKLSVKEGKPWFNAMKYSKKPNQKKWRVIEAYSENLTFEFSNYERETSLTTQTGWVKPTAAPEQPVKRTEPAQIDGLRVIDYSDRAVCIYGNTRPIKDELKALGARFNPFLTIEGQKTAGWVLPAAKRELLNQFVN